MEANSGLELPFLEDANAIQVTIQEIMQAILDRRIDNKRAGLLLYSLQLASSNIRNLKPLPSDLRPHIANIGDEDEEVFNDCIGDDDRDASCEEDCEDCAEEDCDSRTEEPEDIETNGDEQAQGDEHDDLPASPLPPRKPVQPATLVHDEALSLSSHQQKSAIRSPRLPRAPSAMP